MTFKKLCLRIIQGQLQLNVIQGQPFYYNLEKEFNTDGYDLQIMQPDLGLSIQGGFTQGPLNTNINVDQIVSTSLLEEFNLIAFLKLISPLYYIELVQYDYQGIFGSYRRISYQLFLNINSCLLQIYITKLNYIYSSFTQQKGIINLACIGSYLLRKYFYQLQS